YKGKRVATLPGDCDGAETGWFGSRVRGGFVHPGGRFALIKLKDVFERMESAERYLLIGL
ncbi:MAG: hypothetical protein KJO07_21350, partial [Deltaproteobacteria bacterium]|nr:hypothetical protein [Deltaproteobacteria bacterium]